MNDWDAIGAIGQMLGSITVFVTLGYLAVQVRHARQEVRRSIAQGRAESARQTVLSRAMNEQFSSIYMKANVALGLAPMQQLLEILMERAGLTRGEVFQLSSEQFAWWQYRVQHIPYLDELPSGERVQFDLGIRQNYLNMPLDRLWYEQMKAILNPDAVAYVDNLLAQPV